MHRQVQHCCHSALGHNAAAQCSLQLERLLTRSCSQESCSPHLHLKSSPPPGDMVRQVEAEPDGVGSAGSKHAQQAWRCRTCAHSDNLASPGLVDTMITLAAIAQLLAGCWM